MNENDMLNELLTYAAYDTDKVRDYWNVMDEDQKIVAFTLYTSGWNYEALECVEIAHDDDYVLYSEYCDSMADVAKEEFECFDARTAIKCFNDVGGWEKFVNWELVYKVYPEDFDEDLFEQELYINSRTQFVNWEAVGAVKDSVHNMIHSDVTGRWVEIL